MSPSEQTQFQVEVQICVGHKKPIPIPDFPELPAYIFGSVGPPESREMADERASQLLVLNPGYRFCIRQVAA